MILPFVLLTLSCLHKLVVSITYFFFNDTATTEIYTLSLHDALPISTGRRRLGRRELAHAPIRLARFVTKLRNNRVVLDRKSTRLNSSHPSISYAVFCLKKKTKSVHEVICEIHVDKRHMLWVSLYHVQ